MSASVLPCARCGAPLPLESLEAQPQVRCTHCGAESALDEAQRAQAIAQVAAVRAAWRATLRERQRTLASKDVGYVALFVFALLFGLLLTVVVLSPDFPAHWGLVAFTLAVYLTIGASARRAFQPPSAAMLLASGLGACARCGGPIAFEEGASTAACGHCRADCVVNPSSAAQRIRAAAERLQLTVELRRESERATAVIERWLGRLGWLWVVCLIAAIPAHFVLAYLFLAPEDMAGPWRRPVLLLALLLLVAWGGRGFQRMRRRQLAFDALLAGRAPGLVPPRAAISLEDAP